jgi:hypothetical protein
VCRVIVLLAVNLSSSGLFPVAPNLFLRPNSLARYKYLNIFPPHHNFLSCFPIATSLPLFFITTLVSFCDESFHSAWRLRSELLELFLLVTKFFYHYHSNRSLQSISFSIFCAERVLSFIITHAEQTHICIMKKSQDIRKKARSGRAVRSKPQYLALINEDPNVRAYFE